MLLRTLSQPLKWCVLGRPPMVAPLRPPMPRAVVGAGRGMAGHSKWANIRHIKALKDSHKQKTVTKCIQMIRRAIKEGGSADPKLNSSLARVIDFAKSQNMQASTITNTLKQSQKAQDNAKAMLLEYKVSGGLFLLVEVFTDNILKARSSIQAVIKKTGIQEAKGSVQHLFNEKGVIVVTTREGKDLTPEDALEVAIEVGAEDVEQQQQQEEEEEGGKKFVFTCSPDAYVEVKKGVEDLGHNVTYANVDFIPSAPVSLPQDEMQQLDAIIEKLEALDDVMRIHVNL